jgi:cytochrome c
MLCLNRPTIMQQTGSLVLAVWFVLLLHGEPAAAQLRGHGGPVRGLAISKDGSTVLSGCFDSTAILWDLPRDAASEVLRLHDSAINAVALLDDARAITAGEDARIALWTPGRTVPDAVFTGHTGPIAALAVSPDGETLASASWDGTIRLWKLSGGEPVVLEGHAQSVNGVAFMPDGEAVVSAGYDATVRIWPLTEPATPIVTTLPAPLNAVAVAADGEITAASADGRIYFLSPAGEPRDVVAVSPTPVIALAISGDGTRIAAATISGAVAILDRKTRNLARKLVGPGVSAWSVALAADGRLLLTAGADGVIRRWDAETGQAIDPVTAGVVEDPLAVYAGDPGAGVSRLRRLPYAQSRRTHSCRPVPAPPLRPAHSESRQLQLFQGAAAPRYRVDARDGSKTVRDRSRALHPRYQDAGATHQRARRSRGARQIPGKGDAIVSRRASSRVPSDSRRWCAAAGAPAPRADRSLLV